jgi:ribonucleotide monophosphatase NagD (HAD superfamily)
MDSIPFQPGEAIESVISKLDKSIDALVLGYDINLTYQKICLISFFVQTGVKFIATNPDKYTMIGNFKVPGNGSFLKLIEEATSIKGEVVGKPNPFIIEHIINKLNLDKT